MSGKNQHYVPRLAQDGFVSRGTGTKRHTWLFHKERSAQEPNLSGSCAERYFYGSKYDVQLDDVITEHESRVITPLWAKLRAAPSGPIASSGIPDMLAHLEVRTRTHREILTEPFRIMLETLSDRPRMVAHLLQYAEKYVRKNPKIVIPGNSSKDRELRQKLAWMTSKNLQAYLSPIVEPHVDAMVYDLKLVDLPAIIKRAHNSALLNAMPLAERAEMYQGLSYQLVDIETNDLILSDTMVCFKAVDRVRWFPSADKELTLESVILPLSSSRVLVGGTIPDVSAKNLNSISAKCALNQFISREDSEDNRALVPFIGDWSGRLEMDEITAILDEGIRQVLGVP